MADERDEDQFNDQEGKSDGKQTTGQQSQQNEFGQQRQQATDSQGSEGSFGGQSGGQGSSALGAGAGQPIGGNDSRTGSGTTLSQGSDVGGQSSTGPTQSTRSGTATNDH